MKEQNGFISERKQSSNDEQPDVLSFGNYDLVRRIDVGGMGEVYLARQRTAFGREVAVKIIRPDLVNDAVARQRFLREAEVGSYLKHNYILPLLEFGEEQGRLFIVTPYVAGGTLAQRIERGPLSLPEVHELFGALLRAVAYLHKRGIVHRDLKPSNILLDKEEDSERVYVRLIDFGIAVAQGLSSTAALTGGNGELGTAAYMAPERRKGVAAPSNDIYSLGVILYLMLTGSLPARSDDLQVLPQALASVVARCLAPDPARRFASADELAGTFEKACRAAVSERSPVRSSSPSLQAVTPSQLSPAASTPASQNQIVISPLERLNQRRGSGEYTAPDVSGQRPETSSHLPTPGTNPRTNPRLPVPRRQFAASFAETARVQPAPAPALSTAIDEEDVAEKRSVLLDRRNSTNPRLPLPAARVLPKVLPKVSPQAGTVLPAPTKQRFKRDDYDAPTTWLDRLDYSEDESDDDDVDAGGDGAPAKQGFTLRNLSFLKPRASADAATSSAAPNGLFAAAAPALSLPGTHKRRGSLGLLVTVVAILVVLALVGVSYLVYISSMVATVTVGPRLQTVSEVLTMTASPNVTRLNAAHKQLPASALSVSRTASLQGSPTGVSGCVLGIFECKQTVSLNDITSLSAQLRPGLKTAIAQQINSQASAKGVMTIGSIVYADGDVVASPAQGTVSKKVTVTLTEQGSIEYIKTSDAQTLAQQLLKQKTPSHYSMLDSMTRVGQPVIRNVEENGDVQIAIAAAGVARYQLSDDELAAIQKHLSGMSIKAAQAYVAALPNLDPSLASVKMNYGDSIPTSAHQIKITQLQPTNIPTPQLPKVSR